MTRPSSFLHPIAVAMIVANEIGLGANPICAALLHDVVEDTDHTVKEIREMFGEDVAMLVGVVTKHKSEKYEISLQVDNYKQMLQSIHYDIRALLLRTVRRYLSKTSSSFWQIISMPFDVSICAEPIAQK